MNFESFASKTKQYGLANALAVLLAGPFKLAGRGLDELFGLEAFFEPLLSTVPAMIGVVLGMVAEVLFNIPAFIGHFLDTLCSFPFDGFDHVFALSEDYELSYYKVPAQMSGPFGFILGFIPELIRFSLVSIAVACVSAYEWIESFFVESTHTKPTTYSTKKTDVPSGSFVHPNQKQNRYVADDLQLIEKDYNHAIAHSLDLFDILGIDAKTYQKLLDKENFPQGMQAYSQRKRNAVHTHKKGGNDDAMKSLNIAKNVLLNKEFGEKYYKAYINPMTNLGKEKQRAGKHPNSYFNTKRSQRQNTANHSSSFKPL